MKKSLFSALLLSVISCFLFSSNSVFASSRAYNPAIENSYGVEAFNEKYSAGYLAMTADGYKIGNSLTETDGKIFGYNHSRDDDAYIDLYGGAVIDGVKYDVREYLWLGDSGSQYQRRIGSTEEVTAYYICLRRNRSLS